MGGLIKKDFMYLTKQPIRKLICFLIGFIIGLPFARLDFAIFFSAILPFAFLGVSFGFDEKSNWSTYERFMPVSALKKVTSKYIYNFILLLIPETLAFLMYMVLNRNFSYNIYSFSLAFSGELIVASIIIPLYIIFGGSDKNISTYIISVIPLVFIYFLTMHICDDNIMNMDSLNWVQLTAVIALPILAIVISLISIKISEIIYKNKELA